MAAFRFSRRAEADFDGNRQLVPCYMGRGPDHPLYGDLETCCQQLADNPELGRAGDDIRPGLRPMEHRRHVVFYRQEAGSILVYRAIHILAHAMLTGRKLKYPSSAFVSKRYAIDYEDE